MTNLIATDMQGTTVDSGVVSLFEITLLHSGNTFRFCEGIYREFSFRTDSSLCHVLWWAPIWQLGGAIGRWKGH